MPSILIYRTGHRPLRVRPSNRRDQSRWWSCRRRPRRTREEVRRQPRRDLLEVVHRPGHRADHYLEQGAEAQRLPPRYDFQTHTG